MSLTLEPKIGFKIWIGLFLTFLLAFPTVSWAGNHEHPDWKFVRSVLLAPETGEDEGIINRWVRPASVFVVSDDNKYLSIVLSAITKLNAVLEGTGMSLLMVLRLEKPDIFVRFVQKSRLRETGAEYGCDIKPYFVAYTCLYGKTSKTLEVAMILATIDDGSFDLSARIREEFAHALGLIGHIPDPAFEDSLLYVYHDRKTAPGYKELSRRDKKLLRFLYTHLKPGDREVKVRAAFNKYWDKIKVPK